MKMNNKGFTLVELLATIVLIGLVMGIATNGVLSSIETSKKRSEKLFAEKTGKLIEEYLSTYGSKLDKNGKPISFDKTYEDLRTESKTRVEHVTATEVTSFNISELIDKGLVNIDKFINPANKEQCLIKSGTNYTKNTNVRVWQDTDYVYYYYADLSNLSCKFIDNESAITTNIPKQLCNKIKSNAYIDDKGCILS